MLSHARDGADLARASTAERTAASRRFRALARRKMSYETAVRTRPSDLLLLDTAHYPITSAGTSYFDACDRQSVIPRLGNACSKQKNAPLRSMLRESGSVPL